MKQNGLAIYRADHLIYSPYFFNPSNSFSQNTSLNVLNDEINNVARAQKAIIESGQIARLPHEKQNWSKEIIINRQTRVRGIRQGKHNFLERGNKRGASKARENRRKVIPNI